MSRSHFTHYSIYIRSEVGRCQRVLRENIHPKSPAPADGPAADSLRCSGLECKRAAVGAHGVSVCGVAG